MYKTETLMQYFNSMRELANRCDSKIDEASIIQYVINGIDGPRSDKIIIYGATSFSEFKQKLRTYETVIKNMGVHNSNSPNFRHSYESRGRDFKQQSYQIKPTKFNASDAARNPQRCFNCNDIGHLSKSCPNHSRGPRCLSCNLYGHKSFECRRANLNNTSTPPSGVNAVHELPSPINMCKDVTNFGRKFNGLVDTGSILTLLRNSTYINIDAPPLKQTNTLLTAEVEQLLSTYSPKKTKTVNIELDIALTDVEPIFHKPRRLPFAERDIVDAQVDEWVKNGIVEPCSSPYASQVVVVKKKDGKSRVCIDYRRLNRKLIKDKYPLPLIDDILDCLQNAKIFTTLDLKNGFFHVAVNERSRKFTSFVTHNGQYQFRRMPFGLSTCPSTFMRYINAIFRHLISKSIVLPYMDDVVIIAANESQTLEYLKIVLEVACDYGLEINFKKCQFLHNTIEFLGHIIGNGRLFPSPSKTKAVINYPDLKNIKDVRRFLGLTGYFRKFLPSYSTIAKPLSDLIRKDSLFQFYAEQQTAFQKLKYLLSQQPVLSIFNQNSPTEIHTDASINGLGAVLLQKSIHDNQFHPVFYMSKKTSDHERKYTSFELEVLAVVDALKKFRIYVLGTSFKIITDCDALVKTLSKKELNPRIARWALYLQEFNYTIEHRTGSKMAHVDALSRPPHCMLIQNSVYLQFLKAQQADDKITTIKTLLNTTAHDNYIVKNKLLYKTVNGTDLLVVPDEMQANIIKTAHERGHFAVLRTQDLVSKDFYIPRLNTKSTDAAEVINRLENQRHVFGNPARIITDKGSAFTSSAFEDYCKKQNILHISITTGLPRSNGQIEKQNSTIIAVLSKLSVNDPEKWYSHVPHLQEILNSTFQRSIKMTPFELLFGTKMKSCQDIETVELLNDETTAQFQEQRDALRQDAKKQFYKVQDENRRTYNLRRRQAHKYQLDDLVAIKRTQFGPGLKLKQKYLGPYKVTKVKHNDTYDVEKCDFVDGPSKTSTCAEFMKLCLSQTNST
ncbi:retrovirus-related Pol polyprotein from transposon 297 [Trichonephila clavipes]|nr:retrovirus-related Pol polyprotein from transposon 297 [Trichonephila clavipes]